jgi:hypothetical protein
VGWEVVFGDALYSNFHVLERHPIRVGAYIQTDVINIPYTIICILLIRDYCE